MKLESRGILLSQNLSCHAHELCPLFAALAEDFPGVLKNWAAICKPFDTAAN